MPALDDRTLGAAVVAGLLVASSANRLQRASERAMRAQMSRELDAFRHAWQRRLSRAVAVAGAVVGLVLVGYALRRYRAEVRRTFVDALDAGINEGDARVHRDDGSGVSELPLTGPAA